MRVERSGARTEKGAGWKWAHSRGEGKVRGRDLFCGERVYFIDGGCGGPGGGSFVPASERSEHRWILGGKANRFAGRGQYMS